MTIAYNARMAPAPLSQSQLPGAAWLQHPWSSALPSRCARLSRGALAAAAVLLIASVPGQSQTSRRIDGATGARAYAVSCEADADEAGACVVDRSTYVGWQVFHRTCAVCHAADAAGSGFAPNLVRRIRQMEATEFRRAMDEGYAGDAEMPPWQRDPDVRPFFFELWAYLSARANGDLPPGEPRVPELARPPLFDSE